MKPVRFNIKNELVGFQWRELSNKQFEYLFNSNAFLNIAVGAIRSGKTIIVLIRFLWHVIESPYKNFIMAGNTINSLKRNCIDPLCEMLDDLGIEYELNMGLQELTIQNKRIALFGLDKEGADKKIKGYTAGGSMIDEITTMSKSAVEMVISRNSLPDAKVFATCNPDSPLNFVYTDYVEKEDKEYIQVWNFILTDNKTLTEHYIASLKKIYPMGSVFYKRNILGQWVSGEGIIFGGFTEDNIYDTRKPLSYYDYLEVGNDYGTSTTTCYSLIGIKEFEDHTEYDLICEKGYDATMEVSTQTDVERVDDIYQLQVENNLNKKNVFYCSHDAGSLQAALEKDHRIKMTIDTFKPDTIECIQEMSSLFHMNYLRVHSSCTETIKQIRSYEWDSKAAQKGKDMPVKKDDHYIDSMRAPIMNHLYMEDEAYSELVYI